MYSKIFKNFISKCIIFIHLIIICELVLAQNYSSFTQQTYQPFQLPVDGYSPYYQNNEDVGFLENSPNIKNQKIKNQNIKNQNEQINLEKNKTSIIEQIFFERAGLKLEQKGYEFFFI